ncbi:hypothetical protein [Bradyrhizobium sp. dw_411]|uniref:hypothetical protein n=1 Tax=Bradyrhizobium sp. dw_411 TaxID=2720082 RepID=UPI001BD112F6|nr:hypothetical protein [Bradyrhizobium sp. dw_411]
MGADLAGAGVRDLDGDGPQPKVVMTLMLSIFSIVIDMARGLRPPGPDMPHLAQRARHERSSGRV